MSIFAGCSCEPKSLFTRRPALVHYRTYSHGSGKVSVSVNSIPCPVKGMEGRIVMWSLCRICKESTPFIPMSESTWKYSFGKYLELTFSHSGLQSRTHSCAHDVHRDHMRYFSFRNLAVRFEFEEIVLFEISGPPMNRVPKPESISKWRQQDSEAIKKQVSDYYTSGKFCFCIFNLYNLLILSVFTYHGQSLIVSNTLHMKSSLSRN